MRLWTSFRIYSSRRFDDGWSRENGKVWKIAHTHRTDNTHRHPHLKEQRSLIHKDKRWNWLNVAKKIRCETARRTLCNPFSVHGSTQWSTITSFKLKCEESWIHAPIIDIDEVATLFVFIFVQIRAENPKCAKLYTIITRSREVHENKSARKFSKYRFSKFDYLMFIFLTIYNAYYILWVRVHENKSARKLSKFKVRENKSARKFQISRSQSARK